MPQSQGNYARWALTAAGTLILLYILWNIRSILLLGLAAVLLVTFINIPVSMLSRVGVPRLPAILLTMLGGVLLVYIALLLVLPTLVEQFVILATERIPAGTQEIIDFWNSGELQERLPFLQDIRVIEFGEDMRLDPETLRNVGDQVLRAFQQVSASVVPFVSGVANTLLSILIVLFLTVFMLAEPDRYRSGIIQLVPLWYRERAEHIVFRLGVLMRRWIYGQIIGMTVTGVGTFIGLWIIGMNEAAALAVLTAVFSFVPNFGELLSVSVSLAVGVVQVPDRLFWIIIVIYGVSFIQGQIIGPLIASESVNIPPVLILLGQIIVASFFGVPGIVLAVPIMVILMVLIQEIYIRDILGDETVGGPQSLEQLGRVSRQAGRIRRKRKPAGEDAHEESGLSDEAVGAAH